MTRDRTWHVAVALLVVATLACSTSNAPTATPIVQVVTATPPPPTTSPTAAATLPPATTTATIKPPTVTNTSAPPIAMPTNTAVPPSATLTKTSVPPSATHTKTPVPPSRTPTPTKTKVPPKTEQVLNQVSVAGNAIGHSVANCPSGSIVTGGGFASKSDQSLYVYHSSKTGNGWQVYAKNKSGSSQLLNAYAICLSNVSGTSTQVLDQISAAGGGIGHAVANCPAGSVVTGGGYVTSADQSQQVYNSSQSGNGWEVYARNTSGSSQLLNAYAICLSGTSGTIEQVLKQITAAASGIGQAVAACPSGRLLTGGGFAGNDNLFVYTISMEGNGWETYARNTSGSGQLLNSYAMCIKFP